MKMKKCARVKNPCKICLQTVTNKTGVQCKGACQKWVHYTCLKYTPGKIKDIKAGLIRITCPCPNCNTQEPKEILTDPPYNCENQECPANRIPTCEIEDCPMNKMSRGVSPINTQVGPQIHKSSDYNPPVLSPEMTKICPIPCENMLPPCVSSPGDIPPCVSQPIASQTTLPQTSPSTSSLPPRKDAYTEENTLPMQARSQSCSCMFVRDTAEVGNQDRTTKSDTNTTVLKSGDCKVSCSDSKISNNKENQKLLLCNIHQLCSTVGHLSGQIKDLMCRMITSLEKDD